MKIWSILLLMAVSTLFAACAGPRSLAELEHQRVRESQELRDYAKVYPLQTARVMGRIQSTAYASDLVTLLAYSDSRDEAIFAIGQLGLSDEWLPALQSSLATALLQQEKTSPALVAEALGKIGVTPVVSLIEHSDHQVRRKAAVGIWRARGAGYTAHALNHLRKLATDPDAEVRHLTAFALSRPFDPRVVDVLIAMLRDPAPLVRLFAARGLGQAKGFPMLSLISDAMRPLLADTDTTVRVEAAHSLVVLQQEVPASLMSDPNVFVRVAAAAAPKNLEAALQSDSASVRRAALLSPALVDTLPLRAPEFINSTNVYDRASLAEALAAQPSNRSEVIPMLRVLANDPDERVQAAAVTSMKAFLDQGTEQDVIKALGSPMLSVRASAVDVLRDRDRPNVRESLRTVYRDSQADLYVDVREDLVDVFTKLGGEELTLRTMVGSDPSTRVRALAARALRAPPLVVNPPPMIPLRSFTVKPQYKIETSRGAVLIELEPSEAPQHVSSFDALVERQFFDGTLWHRVVPNFVVQGGDPRGDGWGNGSVHVNDEVNRLEFVRGTIGMPKSTKDTGGCQLFIVHLPTPHLDGRYTAFGHVLQGLDVVDSLEVGDRITSIRKLR